MVYVAVRDSKTVMNNKPKEAVKRFIQEHGENPLYVFTKKELSMAVWRKKKNIL